MPDTNGKKIKLKGKHGEFKAEDFTATNWATAEDKAKWADKFTNFILSGFQRAGFKKETYGQLHKMFGHCAEYDINGFYFIWFEDMYKRLHWVETVATSWLTGIGKPQFTWSDVEIKLITWIQDNNIRDQVAGYLQAETEQKDHAMLKVLQDRYGVVPIASAADTVELRADSTSVHMEIPVQEQGQLRLF